MKKVLFVIETLRGGGAERALSNIVTHFPEDWHIDILLNDESLIGYPHRGNILSLSRPEKKSAVYFIGNIIRRTFYLRKLKKNNGYMACISFLDSANISNILSGKKHCKTIVSIRNNMMSENTGLIEKIGTLPLTKMLYIYADKIVAVSKEIEYGLIYRLKVSGNKVTSIVNGCDCKWVRRRMEMSPSNKSFVERFVSDEYKIVVTTGRIVGQKGQWHLIRAFSEVVKKEPRTLLAIIGNGPKRGYLEEVICAFGLEEKVILIGHSDNPFWYYTFADVFVLPSLWEGYPNALAEAVCCGLPCIATDVHSGSREILAPGLDVMGERISEISEEEYGILVPVCSGTMYQEKESLEAEEQKMCDAIIMLLCDNRKREFYRQRSIERSKELDINAKVNQWINIIMEKNKFA